MGAQQSYGRDSNAQGEGVVKTCYYEALGVDRHATEDEIKKAYRKKALQLHPDRNYGNVKDATVKFADVSSAYEVLSDPQERAWYDSHRESILRGESGATEEDHFEHSVRLTSAGDIVSLIGRFNASVPFTDAPNGFYGILRETFATLAREEDSACDLEGIEVVDYPDFGESADVYEDTVKSFYRVWINFSTEKTFSWRDAYRTSDGPDRATRRLIEKENKRLRDEGIREFNDAVRSLTAFVRKRDPRYTPNSQSEADRQKILRDAAAAQAARSRAANRAKYDEHVVPDWAKTQDPVEEGAFSGSEESVTEHIECVVCDKIFKSEKQYEAHEKSKRHIKAVHQLRREMRKENKNLNLDTPSASGMSTPAVEFSKLDLTTENTAAKESSHIPVQMQVEDSGSEPDGEEESRPTISKPQPGNATEPKSSSSDFDNEFASRKQVERRLANSFAEKFPGPTGPVAATSVASEDGEPLGKAKRAKKSAQQEESNFRCAACDETFTSKTKLFNHIKEENHAQAVPKTTNGRKKKR